VIFLPRMRRVDQPNLSGQVLAGKYELGDEIGAGGMGVVYAAMHSELKAPCAVKVVANGASSAAHSKRLLREARVLARLSGQHAVRVLDAGRMPDGSPYLVMERLWGEPLSALLRREQRLPLTQALTFALQVCEAVREVHSHGIIHRDLKPSNVFVVDETHIKVLDFGLAILLDGATNDSTATASEFAGSPSYMSPEQIRASAAVTPSSDIWAIGVLTFEMLTGRLPFEGANQGAMLASIVADPHLSLRSSLPSAPPELECLLAECLEKRAKDRPHDVALVQARLRTILEQISPSSLSAGSPASRIDTSARDATLTSTEPKVSRSRRPRARYPALAAVAVAAVATLALFFETRARRTALPPSTLVAAQPVRAMAPPAEPTKAVVIEASTPEQAGRRVEAVPSVVPRATAPRTPKSKTEQRVLDAISTRN
jgi:eukaryotic-like serine/threonine-protein kinase